MNSEKSRSFDLVIWGATGFTGSLVAAYLVEAVGVGGDVSWAIAGRDRTKLEATRGALGKAAAELPILVGDADDLASLRRIAGDARVVVSTVGPYSKFGSALVLACVEEGSDYCDLAGESPWIRKMIDLHHERARETGARIVHCCGFDSIPSDLGVYFLNERARAEFGEPCSGIRLRVASMKGGVSGGTAESILALLEGARESPELMSILRDPYCLNPPGERSGPDGPDKMGAGYDPEIRAWVGPFIMAGINTRVVRRTNALLGYRYGRDFRYEEATVSGPGFWGRGKALAAATGLGTFALLGSFSPGRTLVRAFLPKPGEGPSESEREAGSFRLVLLGRTKSGKKIRVEVKGDRDPGYGATSRMLAESALCLLGSRDGKSGGGSFTPASAMAEALIKRLAQNAGLRFRVVEGDEQ